MDSVPADSYTAPHSHTSSIEGGQLKSYRLIAHYLRAQWALVITAIAAVVFTGHADPLLELVLGFALVLLTLPVAEGLKKRKRLAFLAEYFRLSALLLYITWFTSTLQTFRMHLFMASVVAFVMFFWLSLMHTQFRR